MQAEQKLIQILLVEDDAVDAMLVRRTLAGGAMAIAHLIPAYELTHVADLDGALRQLAERIYDVVLLDLNLGTSRGIDTYYRVHEAAPEVPVVVLTGLADDEIAVQAIRNGAQDFLVKEQLDARLLGRALRYAVERQHVREEQRKARQYLDIADVILLVIDADQRVSLINRRGSEILGYPEARILGSNWFDEFIPEAIREELRAEFDRAMHGNVPKLEYHENAVLTATGERLIGWHNRILEDGRGQVSGVLSSGEDITERRLAENALRESERRLSTLMANLPGMAYRGVANPDFAAQFVSEGARVVTGYAPEALIGSRDLTYMDLIHPEDRERLMKLGEQTAAEQRPFGVEYRIRTASGEERWVEDHGRLVDMSGPFPIVEGIVTDITARKQAEQELLRYTERLRTLQAIDRDILAAESPHAIADVALSRISTLIPPACCAIVLLFDEPCEIMTVLASTYAPHQVGRQFPTLGMPGVSEMERGEPVSLPDLAEFAEGPEFLRELHDAGVRAGAAVPLLLRGEVAGVLGLLRREHGAFMAEELAIARELADSVAIGIHQGRLFEQIRQYSRELEQRVAERTAALRETNAELEAFAYSVSHDLRNPLANIQGFTELLRDSQGDALNEVGRECVASILASVSSTDALIEDLLAYSRITRAEIELVAVPLEPLVDAVVGQFAGRLAESGGELVVERPLPVVRGHAATLERVLANLIGNAITYHRPGVPPLVRIRAGPLRQGYVRLWIEDNGIGIRQEDQARIFRVFERATNLYPGTGIGLATVRRGVERLGGQVGVESEPGHGSRFWVELPEARS